MRWRQSIARFAGLRTLFSVCVAQIVINISESHLVRAIPAVSNRKAETNTNAHRYDVVRIRNVTLMETWKLHRSVFSRIEGLRCVRIIAKIAKPIISRNQDPNLYWVPTDKSLNLVRFGRHGFLLSAYLKHFLDYSKLIKQFRLHLPWPEFPCECS